jgi:hypothetical protein
MTDTRHFSILSSSSASQAWNASYSGSLQVLARAFNLFSSRLWIYRLSAFGFGVDVGRGSLGGPKAPVGRYRRIYHHSQKEVEPLRRWGMVFIETLSVRAAA